MKQPNIANRGLPSPVVLLTIGVVLTLIMAATVVIVLWWRTGDATAVSKNAAIIGALVALGGVFTTQWVTTALEAQRAQRTQELEAERATEARELEENRAQEAALQKYLAQVGELQLNNALHDSNSSDEAKHSNIVLRTKKLLIDPRSRNSNREDHPTGAREVARAHTLATLEALHDKRNDKRNDKRKRILLQFLHDLNLIVKDQSLISLRRANLSEADLAKVNLRGADLSGADLRKANLDNTDLRDANLEGAILEDVSAQGTELRGADLSGAQLRNAVLYGAVLIDAKLSEARAQGANFGRANLSGANLSGAILREASLESADLSNADLSGAIVTDTQLAECISLKNTILPDPKSHRNKQAQPITAQGI
jgi:uncharacterized protein YjbI with pentapeptide repeats